MPIDELAEHWQQAASGTQMASRGHGSEFAIALPRPPNHASADAKTNALPAPKVTAHDRLPLPGTVLTRKYRGRQVEAKVLPDGFEYEGQVYRSLSAVAKAVTGSHWNGHLFFGLTTLKRSSK